MGGSQGEICTVGVRGTEKECFMGKTRRTKEMEAEKKKPIRPQAGWDIVDMILLLTTAVDFKPRADT